MESMRTILKKIIGKATQPRYRLLSSMNEKKF